MERKYLKKRIMCTGIIKGCTECNDKPFQSGFCSVCRRPLDRTVGEDCNSILGYKDGDLKKRGKIDIICKVCNTIITF